MEKTKLVVSYDRDADVFYLSFGEPRPSVSEELDEYVLVRRDPATRKVTGIIITNPNEYFAKKREIKLEIPAS